MEVEALGPQPLELLQAHLVHAQVVRLQRHKELLVHGPQLDGGLADGDAQEERVARGLGILPQRDAVLRQEGFELRDVQLRHGLLGQADLGEL